MSVTRLLHPSGISGRLIRGGFWSTLGSVAAALCSVITGILCARIMGRSEYGYFGVVVSTATLFGTTIGTALSLTLIKYLSDAREAHSADQIATLKLTRRLAIVLVGVLATSTMALSSTIAQRVLNANALEHAVAASAILVAGQIYTEWQLGALLGNQRFAAFGIASASRSVVLFAGTVIGAKIHGIVGAVIGAGSGLATTAAILEVSMRSMWRGLSDAKSEVSTVSGQQLLAYFTPAFLGAIAFQPFIWWAHTLIVRSDNGASQMAIVSVGMQWRALMTFLPINLQKAALPILTAGYARSATDGRTGLLFSHYITEILVWITATVIIIAAPLILRLYGNSFASECHAFTLIVGGLGVGFLGYAYGTVILSKGWVWVGAIGNLLCGVIVGMFTYMSHQRTAVTFGMATLVAYFVLNVFTIAVLVRRSSISPLMGAGSVVSSITMIAVTIIVGQGYQLGAPCAALVAAGLCAFRVAKLLQLARAQPAAIS